MSLQDDVNAVKRCLDELVRSVGQLERDLAREQAPQERQSPAVAPGRPESLAAAPDTPFGASGRRGAEGEGTGHRDHRSP
ncbi:MULTISPECIES: hypothetical protein [unclassified Streptomyces]|uniref:hypothetical protein n=1 Tax=unclassified Streptomyces TaxID=2593676 RepID=UPI0008DCD10E|nr:MULTISPECIES: hypothetical protein [unclassified Streptomyces]OII69394.1 hypothetical protein BJP39_04190 [Streptomyces sp. CC77]